MSTISTTGSQLAHTFCSRVSYSALDRKRESEFGKKIQDPFLSNKLFGNNKEKPNKENTRPNLLPDLVHMPRC